MRVLRFQISMFLKGRLAPCFGLTKIFQMMAWRVMAHAVANSLWGMLVTEVIGLTRAWTNLIAKFECNGLASVWKSNAQLTCEQRTAP